MGVWVGKEEMSVWILFWYRSRDQQLRIDCPFLILAWNAPSLVTLPCSEFYTVSRWLQRQLFGETATV